jgi:hypothetical protein
MTIVVKGVLTSIVNSLGLLGMLAVPHSVGPTRLTGS